MDLPDDVLWLLNDSETDKTLIIIGSSGKSIETSVKALKTPTSNVIVLAHANGKQLNKDLLNVMDQGSLVSIMCFTAKYETRTAFQVVCSVREFQTSGPLYEKFLDELRARYIDLEGVWVLEPVDVVNRSYNFENESQAK